MLLQSRGESLLLLSTLAARSDVLQQRLRCGASAEIHAHPGRLDPHQRAVLANHLHFDGRCRLALHDDAPRALLQETEVVRVSEGKDRPFNDFFERRCAHESQRGGVREQAAYTVVHEDGLRQRIHEGAITLLALPERFIDAEFAWRG